MKKFSILISILVVLIVLGGCGSSLSKDEVVNKAVASEINSFNIDADIEMDISANGQSMNQSLNMDMTYVDNPFTAHIKMTSINGNIEIYLDKETTYVAQPGTDQWVKTPTNTVPEFADMASGDSIKEELDRLQEFSDLYKLEKSENGYVLSVSLSEDSNEKEMELVKDVMTESMQGMVVEDLKVNKFDYKITLDENFYLKNAFAKADIEITLDGEKATINTVTEADYTEINSLTDYSIPEDVINDAIEM